MIDIDYGIRLQDRCISKSNSLIILSLIHQYPSHPEITPYTHRKHELELSRDRYNSGIHCGTV